MISNKTYLRIICFIFFIINLCVINLFYQKKRSYILENQLLNNKKVLEYFHANCNIENVLEQILLDLFKKIEDLPVSKAKKVFHNWCKEIEIPEDAFRIIVYNTKLDKKGIPISHTPLNAPKNEINTWSYLMGELDTSHKKDFKRITLSITAPLQIDQPNFLIRKPHKIEKISLRPLNTYAIWFKAKKSVEDKKINSIFILIHDSYIKSRTISIVKQFFKINKINNNFYGYLNATEPENNLLPKNLNAEKIISELEKYDIYSGYKDLKKYGIISYAKPNGNIFIAKKQIPYISLPLWTISLFFIWLPIWYWHYINSNGIFKFSISLLIKIMFILTIFFPLIIITIYWNKMISSKYISIKQNTIQRLFNNLVQLDVKFGETLRLNIQKLRNTVDIANYSEKNPLGVDDKEKFQLFIDETVRLELDQLYDQCFIINTDGKLAREAASLPSFYRLLAAHSQSYKAEVIEQFLNANWRPRTNELNFINSHTDGKITIQEFMQFNVKQLTKTLSKVALALGNEMFNLYNTKHNHTNINPNGNEIKSGLISSAMGVKSDEVIHSLYNNLDNYSNTSFNSESYLSYISILCNKNKEAKYTLIMFSEMSTITRRHIKRIFHNSDKWLPNTELLAITDSKNINFPYLDLWKRLDYLIKIIKPPVTQYTSEVNINGEKHILCVYKCNKISNYLLASLLPIKIIEDKLLLFKIKMLTIVIIIFFIVIFILFKMYLSVIKPTQSIILGINSINNKNYKNKVVLKTNDEWEELADTFNLSLDTVKELEIASFLQDTILPSGLIENNNVVFHGQTVSADGIGGDYFDVFTPEKNQTMFLFGDVSGHSVGAALVVSMAHAGFSSLFDSNIKEPSEILKSFSNLMLNNLKRIKMMTCFSGFIDEEGNLKCSNAGQTFPLIVDSDGNITKISIIGYPLGSLKRAKYKQETIKLPDRCRIILYSDGIVEAMNEENEPFGYDRLEYLVKEMACKNTIFEFKKRIYQELKKFTKSIPWNDDCSIAIIDYTTKYVKEDNII